jgi:hypothetical protein
MTAHPDIAAAAALLRGGPLDAAVELDMSTVEPVS